MGDSPYVTLGILRSASTSEVRRAYREKALRQHPDKGGDAVQFQAIQSAYETLSDPGLRRLVDGYLDEGYRRAKRAAKAAADQIKLEEQQEQR
jgi:curved DNA-binding protein CbpA